MNFKNKLAVTALSLSLLCSSVSQAAWFDGMKEVHEEVAAEQQALNVLKLNDADKAVEKAYASYDKSKTGKNLIALDSAIADFITASNNAGSSKNVAYWQSAAKGARKKFDADQVEAAKSYAFSSTVEDLSAEVKVSEDYENAYAPTSWFTVKNAAIVTSGLATTATAGYGLYRLYSWYKAGFKGEAPQNPFYNYKK